MIILITGAGGFVGRYLVQELRALAGKDSIYGLNNIEIAREASEELDGFARIDITDYDSLRNYLIELNPGVIYHLAAQSSVAVSLKEPITTLRINLMGTLNMLEIAAKNLDRRPRILLAGSADLYKNLSGEKPLTEETPFNPLNPYAASKAAVDFLGEVYWENYGVTTIRTRSFNHIGPGQSTAFVMPNFARQIARIEKDLQEPVVDVGDLNVRRDFTDVRDIVKAYIMLMEKGRPGEAYNVCSNNAHSIDEMLRTLLKMSDSSIDIRRDPSRIRPADNPVLIGDNSKLQKDTGWKPKIPIKKTLEDLLNYWREKV